MSIFVLIDGIIARGSFEQKDNQNGNQPTTFDLK